MFQGWILVEGVDHLQCSDFSPSSHTPGRYPSSKCFPFEPPPGIPPDGVKCQRKTRRHALWPSDVLFCPRSQFWEQRTCVEYRRLYNGYPLPPRKKTSTPFPSPTQFFHTIFILIPPPY